jgi:co-chaperonin GroES (HSP10)|tara:strand:+ start:1275 stop:1679 length:405 start_codon:yes stop_codon:yes gene_type:complete
MAINLNTISGTVSAIGDRVIVSDMYFGEQTTAGGVIVIDDDANTRGIYPRWGRVHSKGPRNKDEYAVGDWVLVEHGRWTRGYNIDDGNSVTELRMIDAECILASSEEKPDGVSFGNEYSDGEHATIDPSSFVGA